MRRDLLLHKTEQLTKTVRLLNAKSRRTATLFPWLDDLKARQLRQLAQETGLHKTADKAGIINGLEKALAQFQQDHEQEKALRVGKGKLKERRILSIDMGIQNFAFAILGVDIVDPGPMGPQSFLDQKKKVRMLAWHKVSLPFDHGFSPEEFGQHLDEVGPLSVPPPRDPAAFSTSVSDHEPHFGFSSTSGPPEDGERQKNDRSSQKRSFSLPVYATHAHSIIITLLDRYKPTHVLIERQRFRSGSCASVLEWTLRVGVFEGMIWTALHALQQQKKQGPKVIAMDPAKVATFWIPPSTSTSSSSSSNPDPDPEPAPQTPGRKVTRPDKKRFKVDLVGSWLEKDIFQIRGRSLVQRWVDAYKEKWKKPSGWKKKRSKYAPDPPPVEGVTVANIGKLDDLADCLVQGMTWLEWERMKESVLREGAKALK
ncbi:mitochondrial resolvase Ydc2 [Aspergillus aurantiobrunneus]